MTEPSSNLIRQLTEAITASREVADRRIDALNAAVERTTQKEKTELKEAAVYISYDLPPLFEWVEIRQVLPPEFL